MNCSGRNSKAESQMNMIPDRNIDISASVRDALVLMESLSSTGNYQVLFVMESSQLVGVLSNGDIRRYLISHDSLDETVEKVMNREFYSVNAEKIDVEMIKRLRTNGICVIPCINKAGELTDAIDFKYAKSVLPIDVVLMAGGKGMRLRPLTEKTPKPLLPLGNKTIIDCNIDSLVEYGVKHFNVTTKYLADQIENHLQSRKDGIAFSFTRETDYLGTFASVKLVENLYNDVILVMNSDLFTNIDFEKLYLTFHDSNADMAVAVIPYSINIPYGIFEHNGENIIGVSEKPKYNYYANGGIYMIKRELVELIPSNVRHDAIEFIEEVISRGKKVVKFPMTGFWIDIGTHTDYKKAQDVANHIGVQ